jgi:hypothetical protein
MVAKPTSAVAKTSTRLDYAGVQIGEFIHRDMIAVRVTKEMRLAIVGPPGFFESNPIPRRPQDLKDHSCYSGPSAYKFSTRQSISAVPPNLQRRRRHQTSSGTQPSPAHSAQNLAVSVTRTLRGSAG